MSNSETQVIAASNLKPGHYEAVLHGYELTLRINKRDVKVEVDADAGIRCRAFADATVHAGGRVTLSNVRR